MGHFFAHLVTIFAIKQLTMEKENIYLNRIFNKHEKQEREQYPFSIPVIANFKELVFNKSVTYIVGPNGSGKSTLLEAIAVLLGMNPEGGTRNFNFRTVDSHSSLWEELGKGMASLSFEDTFFFRAESYYNVISEIDRLAHIDPSYIAYYGGKSIHERSHGEGFIALIQNRLQGRGIYIFDEPEAALSFVNQLAFLCWIKEVVQQGAQIIISTHSPVVLSYPDACIYEIEYGYIHHKSYDNCSVYRDLHNFILNRELYLKQLGL